jgi:hypothetical protein
MLPASAAVIVNRVLTRGKATLDLDQRPILVFWETTKACDLACRHCRASAISQPLEGDPPTADAARFVDSLAGFGMPRPVLIATGGDVLLRHDLDAMLDRARALKLPVGLAPSVTPLPDARPSSRTAPPRGADSVNQPRRCDASDARRRARRSGPD